MITNVKEFFLNDVAGIETKITSLLMEGYTLYCVWTDNEYLGSDNYFQFENGNTDLCSYYGYYYYWYEKGDGCFLHARAEIAKFFGGIEPYGSEDISHIKKMFWKTRFIMHSIQGKHKRVLSTT